MPRYTSPTKFSSALDACAARTAGVLPSTAQGRVVARGERRHRAALRPCAVLVRPSTAAVRSAAAALRSGAALGLAAGGRERAWSRWLQVLAVRQGYCGVRHRAAQGAGSVPGRGGTGSRGTRRACAPHPRLRGTTHARAHMHARTNALTHTCTARTHSLTHAHTHARTHARTHTCTHARTPSHIPARTHTCTHARTHAQGRRGTCARTGRAAREVELAVQIRALLRVPSMDSLRNGYCGGTPYPVGNASSRVLRSTTAW